MKKTDILKLVLVLIAIYCISSWWMKKAGQIDLETLVEGEIYFMDQIQEKEIKYTLWEQNSLKSYLVILPSMYNDSAIDMEVHYNDKYYKMYIDGELYEDGKSWENIRGEQIYNLKVQDIWGRTCLEKPIQFLISQSLPVMMVTVEAKEALYDLQEYSNKQYVEKGNAVMFDEKGMLLIDKKLEKISVRGNTSADLPKKPFRIEFAEEIGLCGMEPAREWNLIANYKDETHIRNKLMLDWADELGEGYNVEGEYLELYVNGEYQGLYLLTETVTVGENRLELEADNSIFAEMELYYRAPEEKNYIVTERSHYWVIHSEAKLSEEKLTDITNWFNEVESALYSENGTGNNTGKALEEMLDFDSWTDAWLLEEISADVDLGTTSQFAYMENWEERSVLMAGPEWDFDSSLGNTKLEIFRNPRNLVVAIPNTKGIECVTQNKWLAPMYQNPLFKEMLVNKFETEIRPKIKQLLEWQIDEYISKIERSVLLDSVRWEKNLVETKEGESIPEDYHRYEGLETRVEYLKEFLREKEKFLVELWVEGAEFEVVVEERNFADWNLELNNDIYTWIRKDETKEKE